ncbi:MAG: hypothetical protein ABIS86_19200 [Streptosporangiaceae bacterium]
MTDNASEEIQHTDPLTQLTAGWPDWKIWRAAGHSWLATRHRDITNHGLSIGLARTLMADTPEDLSAQLEKQCQLEKKNTS